MQSSLKAVSYLFLLATMSCTWDQLSPSFNCETSPVQVEILELVETDCATPNGGFTIGASGGESPYTYSSEAGTSTNGIYQKIGAGSYNVTVSDVNGCTAQIEAKVLNKEGVNLDNILTTQAGCKSSEGTVEIIVSGGSGPYLYSINDGDAQESNVFSGLDGGTHAIGIEDQEGCEITGNVKLTSGVSFNSIEGIINNRCTSCHGVTASPSFGSYDQIKSAADRIMARTSAKTMPPTGALPQSEIDAIACWVNDGALSN